MRGVDVVIAGAGVVGLSLALDLKKRGVKICVLERKQPGAGASRAAAGMLAVHDPANPPELLCLSERSVLLYPEYLKIIEGLGGGSVPFETEWCVERDTDGQPGSSHLPAISSDAGTFRMHREKSLDPRKLFPALLQAAIRSDVRIESGTQFRMANREGKDLRIETQEGDPVRCGSFVDCTGAWNAAYALPVKGQMLRVELPKGLLSLPGKGNVVVRTPHVYLVPRLDGSCLIGATVEDAGFDTEVQPAAKEWLREQASRLLPGLATAPEIESWSGLRPATPSGLPVLGAVADGMYVANGLYRNGILLAPVVAEVLSSLIRGEAPQLDLSPFAPPV